MTDPSRLSSNKEVKNLINIAQSQGWRVEKGRSSSHLRFYPPKGDMVIVASTPSDYRGWKNALSVLKRSGMTLSSPPKRNKRK